MNETSGEVINGVKKYEDMETTMTKPLVETDLGPNNQGSIGPNVSEDQERRFIRETGGPKYHKKPTNVFICVDGRFFLEAPEAVEGQAHPQTAGGMTTTLSSANLMAQDDLPSISELTRDAVVWTTKSGFTVVEHGDEDAAEDGCGARFNQRRTMGYLPQNSGIVVPTVWTIAQLTGLTDLNLNANGKNSPLITKHDLRDMLEQAGRVSEMGELWDATPAQQVKISKQNGGKYAVCKGKHLEGLAVATTVEGQVFDNQQYSSDHTHPATEEPIQAFAAAFGELKKAIFKIEDQNGGNELDATRKTLAAFAFNIGTFKMLKNDRLKTAVY